LGAEKYSTISAYIILHLPTIGKSNWDRVHFLISKSTLFCRTGWKRRTVWLCHDCRLAFIWVFWRWALHFMVKATITRLGFRSTSFHSWPRACL